MIADGNCHGEVCNRASLACISHEAAKGDWSLNEASDDAKHCILK